MRSKFWVIGILVLSVFSGFVQEWTKVSLNFTLECAVKIGDWDVLDSDARENALFSCREFRPSDYYSNHNDVFFYRLLGISNLKILKWVLALVWIIVFWILNRILLRFFFKDNFPVIFLHGVYLITSVIAISFFAIGKWMGSPLQSYGVARELLGSLQSVVPSFILGFGYYLLGIKIYSAK